MLPHLAPYLASLFPLPLTLLALSAWCWGSVAGPVPFKISLLITDVAGWEGGGVASNMACAYTNTNSSAQGTLAGRLCLCAHPIAHCCRAWAARARTGLALAASHPASTTPSQYGATATHVCLVLPQSGASWWVALPG